MIVGITGTIGAGKGTVVDYLVATRGFTHFSARGFLERELRVRSLPPSRDNMKLVADDLRAQHESSYIIEQLFAEASAVGGNAVIESVRTLGEASFLRERGVPLLAVDADRALRYGRIAARGLSTDDVSFEKFCMQEGAELASDDPNRQNILGVMAAADYCIMNDSSLAVLHERVEAFLLQYDGASAAAASRPRRGK